jgi:UDP-glucuronate 4-epimerase
MSLYAATKASMEVLAYAYSHLHKVPITAFRFFTVYGPWGRPDMALFKFVDAVTNDRPIQIHGDGTAERDFTYIEDLVEAVSRLIPLSPSTPAGAIANGGAAFRAINIGAGKPFTVLQLVSAVEQAVGRPAILQFMPPQPGDVPRTFASATLLEQLTGFRPRTSLLEGVRRFVGWYRDWTKDKPAPKPASAISSS